MRRWLHRPFPTGRLDARSFFPAHTTALCITTAATTTPPLEVADLGAGHHVQRTAQKVLKQHAATVGKAQQPRVKARQVFGQVAQIAPQDRPRIHVPRDIHHLRQVDDRWPFGPHQDVVCGQVTVNPPRLEQLFDLHKDFLMQRIGLFGGKRKVRQARRRNTVSVDD
jgi:hypothetical protein